MSKQGGTTTTVSASSPPKFAMPYVDEVLKSSQGLYQGSGPNFYPGSTVAPFAPAENTARNYLQDMAGSRMPQVTDQAQRAFEWGLNSAQDPGSNPYVKSAAEAAVRPVMESLTKNVLPNIRSGAMASGGVGGTRQSLAESLAVDAATRNALDATSNIYNDAYKTGQYTFANTLNQAPMVQGLMVNPGAVLSDVGAQERAMAQSNINEDVNRYMWNQMLPYQKLTEYANMVKGPWGGYGESQVVAPQTGTVEQILGAGMTLLPLLGQLFDLFSGKSTGTPATATKSAAVAGPATQAAPPTNPNWDQNGVPAAAKSYNAGTAGAASLIGWNPYTGTYYPGVVNPLTGKPYA